MIVRILHLGEEEGDQRRADPSSTHFAMDHPKARHATSTFRMTPSENPMSMKTSRGDQDQQEPVNAVGLLNDGSPVRDGQCPGQGSSQEPPGASDPNASAAGAKAKWGSRTAPSRSQLSCTASRICR